MSLTRVGLEVGAGDEDGHTADAVALALARGANWLAVLGSRRPAYLEAIPPGVTPILLAASNLEQGAEPPQETCVGDTLHPRWVAPMVTDGTPAMLDEQLEHRELRLVSVRLSLADRDCASQVLPYCAKRGVDVLARTSLPPDVPHQLDEALRVVMLRHGNARHTVALAWTLAWAPVIAVATRLVREDDVDEALNAAQLKLTSADLDEIATALEGSAFGTGPTRPVVHA